MGLGIWIGHWDWEFGLRIEIGRDWALELGLGIEIGNWGLGLRIGDLDWD